MKCLNCSAYSNSKYCSRDCVKESRSNNYDNNRDIWRDSEWKWNAFGVRNHFQRITMKMLLWIHFIITRNYYAILVLTRGEIIRNILIISLIILLSGCIELQGCPVGQHSEKVVDKEAGYRSDYGYGYGYGNCPDNDGDGGYHYGYCYTYNYHYGYFPEESHLICVDGNSTK